MRVLITSGGTNVKIDKVRHIGNMSSGTFGSAICKAFLEGPNHPLHVDFLMAEGSKSPFIKTMEFDAKSRDLDKLGCFINWLEFCHEFSECYSQIEYKTFEDYQRELDKLLKCNVYDVIVLAAAVSDYGVANYVDGKIRTTDALLVKLSKLPKLISSVRSKQPNAFLVGFKLLVDSTRSDLITAAKKSIKDNDCDMVVANDLSDIQNSNHTLTIVEKGLPNEITVTNTDCENSGMLLARFLVRRIMNEETIFVNGKHIKPR